MHLFVSAGVLETCERMRFKMKARAGRGIENLI
jgi:hypothetical protein